MTSSLSLGRVLGIPIGVNWSIVAVAALFTAALGLQALPRSVPEVGVEVRLAAAAIAVVIFFASILAHEVGHAVAALEHGVGVDGITLWLLGGVTRLDRQAPSPRAEWQIAVAGPAVNLALGVFFAALGVVVYALDAPPLAVALISWLAGVNLILVAFNLLPAAPLDGGKVLTAILWRRMGDAERARVIAGRCGLVLSVALVAIGAVQVLRFGQTEGWVTVVVGAFTFGAARADIVAAAGRRRLAATTVGQLATAHPPAVPDSLTVQRFIQWAGPARANTAHPVTRWDDEPIGYAVPVTAGDGLDGPARSWTSVGEVMVRQEQLVRISSDQPLRVLLERWEHHPVAVAVVTEPGTGRALGTITEHEIRPALERSDLWGRTRPLATTTSPGSVTATPHHPHHPHHRLG